MKFHIPHSAPSLGVSFAALFVALGGSGYAATQAISSGHPTARSASSHADKHQDQQLVAHSTAANADRLGGHSAGYFLPAKQEATSHGVKFLAAGQTVVLGKVGHFTFSSTCSKDTAGQNQVTFDVTADTTADLDGGGPVAARMSVNIHTNSDALDSTTAAPKQPGDFDQVGSASSSTEIAADGQEVDVFYNDGVNWPAGNGSAAHDCFAGYTGLLG
jgi:hypothetical protein